jgi:16S rRNA (cytosine967-C5)-methyltransferase
MARQTALRVLHAIDAEQAYTDVALRQMLDGSALERRGRAFVTACVYGVVRWQGRIDWLLSKACSRPLDALTPWIRNILRLGTYQCLWMERVPPRAAVHASVDLARRFGHAGVAGLVNGVLRTLLRQHATYALPDADTQPAAHLAVAHSHPQWLVERWLDRYGWARTLALCVENNRPRDVTLRINTLRIAPRALAQRLVQEGLRAVRPSRLLAEALVVQGTSRLDTLASYRDGLFQVQDEGAILVAPLCRAQPGQRVLDACAAPGGKTTHLAEIMGDTGQILACDTQASRLRLLDANVRRLRLTSITPVVSDGTGPPPWLGVFDRILVDAPCSGLGVLSRHPDIKWRKDPESLQGMQAMQLALLETQRRCLAADGLLVYSVCSNEPEETRDVVRTFLERHPDMRLEALAGDLPKELDQLSSRLETLDLTPDQYGTEGVFAARFRVRNSQR